MAMFTVRQAHWFKGIMNTWLFNESLIGGCISQALGREWHTPTG